MALDTTVGGVSANSYVAVADVATYLSEHLIPASVTSKWNVLTTAQKEAALIQATKLLDRHVRWRGEIESDVQALSWPRAGALDRYGREITSNAIPSFLKEFQIETALWLTKNAGEVPQVGNAEFDSIRVGSLEIDFNEDGGARRTLLPEEVIAALSPMGAYDAETPGAVRSVSLVRS